MVEFPAGTVVKRHMSLRKQLFVDEYLTGAATGKRFNAAAAYEHAGYAPNPANPSSNAWKLLRDPSVQAYMKDRLAEHVMSVEEALVRLAEIARAEVGDIVIRDPVTGRLDIDTLKVLTNKKYIKNFYWDSNGNPRIEFHDSYAALKDILKISGALSEGFQLGGVGGGPAVLQIQFVNPDGSISQPFGQPAQPVPTEDFSEFEEDYEPLMLGSGDDEA
jgi:hypothetical protein